MIVQYSCCEGPRTATFSAAVCPLPNCMMGQALHKYTQNEAWCCKLSYVITVATPPQKCGKINSWKRVQGTAGKLQAFGFCEYANPESTLRALRLLHGLRLGSKTLTVSVSGGVGRGGSLGWCWVGIG